jgi:outer membrane protein TolC
MVAQAGSPAGNVGADMCKKQSAFFLTRNRPGGRSLFDNFKSEREMKTLLLKTIVLTGLIPLAASAQQPAVQELSLKACIQMSFANNIKLKQVQMETYKSHYQLKEAIGAGLPQINGFASVEDYFDIPVNMVSGEILGQPGIMVPIQLGTKYNTTAGIQAGQMIYDASYFASVRLFKKSCEISDLTLEQNMEELAFNVAQIYLFTQTSARQLALLDSNLSAFRRIHSYSEQHYKNGFILKTDLDRVTVAINNLLAEKDNLLLARNQQLNMLKYLMGVPPDRNIALSDETEILALPAISPDTTFANQIEMKILQQKRELAVMNVKLAQAGFMPSLSGYAVYSQQSPVEQFREIDNKDNWYKTSFIGIKLTVPVFEGNRLRSKVRQSKIELEQVKAGQQDLQNELAVKLKNAFLKYRTNLLSETRLKDNMELSCALFDITNDYYREGLRSFTDVLNARSEYNASYLSWLNSVLQMKLSELEIIKINGTINSLFL